MDNDIECLKIRTRLAERRVLELENAIKEHRDSYSGEEGTTEDRMLWDVLDSTDEKDENQCSRDTLR